MNVDDVEALADEPQELGGICINMASSVKQAVEPTTTTAEVCQLLSDDLHKQAELRRLTCSAASTGCAPVRCLPAPHRTLIVGWMRQITSALKLHLSTLFSATSILDRFIAAAAEMPSDSLLQLVALTCMSVAVKYNEVGQILPEVWLGLAMDPLGCRLYTPRDLQRFEFSLLQTIGWRLHEPDTHSFLEHYLMCTPQQPAQAGVFRPRPGCPVTSRAMALAEISLMHELFLSYDYSTIALACMALAERMVAGGAEPGGWVRRGPAATAVAAAVVATSGLGLEQLAPGLEACADALEKCYSMLYHGKSWASWR